MAIIDAQNWAPGVMDLPGEIVTRITEAGLRELMNADVVRALPPHPTQGTTPISETLRIVFSEVLHTARVGISLYNYAGGTAAVALLEDIPLAFFAGEDDSAVERMTSGTMPGINLAAVTLDFLFKDDGTASDLLRDLLRVTAKGLSLGEAPPAESPSLRRLLMNGRVGHDVVSTPMAALQSGTNAWDA